MFSPYFGSSSVSQSGVWDLRPARSFVGALPDGEADGHAGAGRKGHALATEVAP